MVTEQIRTIPGFPKKLENELIHCILAHHGELEYGSPKKPALIKLLSPVVPHITEELWSKLGHVGSIAYAKWPTYDESKLVEDVVEIVIQINGKVRQHLQVSKDASREELQDLALNDERIKQELADKEIKKVIAVPGKLVSIVVAK